MKVDFQSPIDEFVSKGVLNFGFIAIEVSEEVIAHGNGAVVIENHAGVLETNLGPRVDGKTTVFLASTTVTCDEIRLRLSFRSPELFNGTLGWFEEDCADLKCIHFIKEVARIRFTICSFVAQCTYGNDA